MEMSKLLPKKTKIICTIGPASSEQRVLESMIMNGMNIARINFAHGNFDGHRRTIANIRAASDAVGRRVAIFGDLPGPKMRIGRLAEEPIEIERGQPFTLKTKKCIGNADYVSMNFEELPKVVEPGNSIFLNDGFIQLEVEDVQEDRVHCRVLVGGELRSNKGINLPDIDLGIDVFTQRDLEYLHFAASQELDGISQSFVESAADIRTVREAAQAIGYDPFIIAKIERSRALENLQQILEETDGMMVARGDLGVEIPIERIATTQKKIIAAANLLGKPVITATHMLESMINSRRPTRAEATDVANAILDGTDCVMLSGETAIGSYPIDAVTVMSHIAEETEQHAENFHVAVRLELQEAEGEISREDLIAQGIYRSALTLQPAVVFVPSDTGSTARLVTRFRMQQWLIAPSLKQKTCQRLEFSYGIFPEFIPENPDSWPKYVKNWLDEHKIECDLVLVIQGGRTVRSGDTIRMDIIDLSDA